MLARVVLEEQLKEAEVIATQRTDEYIGACLFVSEYLFSLGVPSARQGSRIVLLLVPAAASNVLLKDMAGAVDRSDALRDLRTLRSLRPLVQVAVPGRHQYRGRRRKYLQDYLTPLPLPIVRCLGANLTTPCGASSVRRPLTTGAGVEVTWSLLITPCIVLVDGVLIAVYNSVV